MPLLSFVLNEEGAAVLHDVLICLNKFSDGVCLEARPDRLVLTAFNSTKSAYASFTCNTSKFCVRYHMDTSGQKASRFYCAMMLQSLIPIFSRRTVTPSQAGLSEPAIDRCDIAVEDDVGSNSRFIVRVMMKNGIRATHRLPFESVPPVHAKFDREAAVNSWSIPARKLRLLLDHFSPGTELLDIHLEDSTDDPDNKDSGVMNFTCFTEKTVSGDQVLKKPLHTSIAVSTVEFTEMSTEIDLHITITVKDFKSIVTHASALNSDVTARFSTPAKPMELSYSGDSFTCDFLLMTVGERIGDGTRRKKKGRGEVPKPSRALDTASKPGPRATPAAETASRSGEQLVEPPQPRVAVPSKPSAPLRDRELMPPPARPQPAEPVNPRPELWKLRPASITTQRPRQELVDEEELLFVTQREVEEEEDQWAPVNTEEQEVPTWDFSASMLDNQSETTFRTETDDTTTVRGSENRHESVNMADLSSLEPTQVISEVRKFGLFG